MEQKIISEADQQANKATQKTESGKKRHASLWLVITIMVVAIVALAYIVVQLRIQQDNSAGTSAVQQQHIDHFQQTLATIQQQQQQQDRQLDITKSNLRKIDQQTNRNDEGWTLDETQYLLRLANLNLYWQHDIPSTVTLLTLADEQLQQLADPTLMNVRDELAQNITALQAIPDIDIGGLMAQLNALSEQLPALSLRQLQFSEEEVAVTESDRTGWRETLASSWKVLQNILIIRHHVKPVMPFLPPEQRAYLEQNLYLSLQQAQWAALQREQGVYQSSLQQVEQWVNDYFDVDNAAAQSLLNNLAKLQTINVNPQLPDIGGALASLQALSQQKQWPVLEQEAQ